MVNAKVRKLSAVAGATVLAGGLAVASLVGASGEASAGPRGVPSPSAPVHVRITGRPIYGTQGRSSVTAAQTAPSGLPTKSQQIKVLMAAYKKMIDNYSKYSYYTPGPMDIIDYGIQDLWSKGIDGAGTTVAVIEGWNYPGIAKAVASFDKTWGLPNPTITTIYPAGKLPAKCPAGMVKLGTYGDCNAWGGELMLDVVSAHLVAPYAKIVISATPADTQVKDDAAAQVAPYEMMEALEKISTEHLANVISISDGTGESTYTYGSNEIMAQDPGELTAAAEGVPVIVASGDCGVVQNLAVANGQCEDVSKTPDSAAWDDSPWITALGGSVPNISETGTKLGPDPLWHVGGRFSEGAGYSSVFSRPGYQNGVAHITHNPMRSVPDITMDSQDGTSEAAPLFAGVLALATQENHGDDVGPINPALYDVLGPMGTKAGIADVVSGNDSAETPGGTVIVPGFTATKGFDVASGWGTIYAPRFVPSLVAATRGAHQEGAPRKQALTELIGLENELKISAQRPGGTCYLLGQGFLPRHPVQLLIDGHLVKTLKASTLGYVTYMIDPASLKLGLGTHSVELKSMLIDMTKSFSSC